MKLLAAHNARFLLIGGYAVNAFGYVRNTVDIDIWIANDAANTERVISAIREFGFEDATVDLLHDPSAMIRMGVPPLRIQVLQSISGVTFEDCWPRRVFIKDGDLEVPMISLGDLRRNKQASGRKKDLLDLEELQ